MPKASPAALKHAFGRVLLELRKNRKDSQEALARIVDLAPDYIGELERGRRDPSLSTIVSLAEALHVDLPRMMREVYQEYRATSPQLAPFTKELKVLRDWVERSPHLMWFCDGKHKCLFANRATLEWMGLSLDQVLADAWRDAIHPADRESYLAFSDKKFRRREPFTTIYRIRRAGGEFVRILQQAHPQFTPRGQFYGFLGVMIPERPEGPMPIDPAFWGLEPKAKKKRAQSSAHNHKT